MFQLNIKKNYRRDFQSRKLRLWTKRVIDREPILKRCWYVQYNLLHKKSEVI